MGIEMGGPVHSTGKTFESCGEPESCTGKTNESCDELSPTGKSFESCGEPVPYRGKKFEFLDIQWEVENFYLATLGKKWRFQTPEFTVRGFHKTRWVMVLSCVTVAEMDFLQLSLKRCENDSGPETVCVDWRVEIFRPNCNHDPVYTVCHFKKGDLRGEDLGIMTDVLKTLEPLESDSLILHCKMIIFSEESREGFEPCSNMGIRSLSEDLLRLFMFNEYKDLELRFTNNSFRVHKVVACSRLKELNILIERERRNPRYEESGERDVVDLSYLNDFAMIQILKYVYSGDLSYVLGEPSLFIYDCVQKLDIEEVKSYYVPNELHFKSLVNNSEFYLSWTIPEKRSLVLLNRTIDSEGFTHYPTGTSWQLHLVPSERSDYYDLRVESVIEGGFVGCIECCIQDDSDRIEIALERKTGPPEVLRICNFKEFLSLSVAPEDTCLRVIVRIRLSDGSTSTRIDTQKISFVDIVPAETCYSLLSSDMDRAYRYGFFSDLSLKIDSTVFRMHRSIIAARSSRMLDLVSEMEGNGVNPFPEIKPSVFRMLLRFLYTGSAIEGDIIDGDFVELYKTAADLGLTVLKQLCFEALKYMMQNNLSIRARVLESARRLKDWDLYYFAEQYA